MMVCRESLVALSEGNVKVEASVKEAKKERPSNGKC